MLTRLTKINTNSESLGNTPETDKMLYVNYTSTKRKKQKNIQFLKRLQVVNSNTQDKYHLWLQCSVDIRLCRPLHTVQDGSLQGMNV